MPCSKRHARPAMRVAENPSRGTTASGADARLEGVERGMQKTSLSMRSSRYHVGFLCCASAAAAVLAAALAACSSGTAGTRSALPQYSYPPTPTPAPTEVGSPIPQGIIRHVVIIVQENRSFNNLFHGFPGA